MMCLRHFRKLQVHTTNIRFLNHGNPYETPDRRKVFYNKHKETLKNWKMVKELEVPNMDADPEKPATGTIERYVPYIPTKPVKNTAQTADTLPSHQPCHVEQWKCRGSLMWKGEEGCVLCNNDINVTYKNIAFLYQFVTNTGRILGPQKTGLCQMSYHVIVTCIGQARDMGLMAKDYKPLEYQNVPQYLSDSEPKDCGF